MKICLLTDTHCGARGDSIAFADYFDSFYYEQFFPYLEEHNIDTVIHLGDLMDKRKHLNYVSATRFNKFFDTVTSKGINFHWIIGNHDAYHKSTNRVNAANELLGNHAGLGTLLHYYPGPTEVVFDGVTLAFVPWICTDNKQETFDFLENTKAQLCLGHLELTGFEMYKGMVNDHGFSRSLFSKFDMVMSGHFHHKSSYQNIHYLGSPFEITWSDWNDPRGFHILDTDSRELTFIQSNYRMFNKLYYDDSNTTLDQLLDLDVSGLTGHIVKVIVINKNNPYWFDQYITKIEKAEVLDLQVSEDNLHLDLISDEEFVEDMEDTLSILTKYSEQYKDRVDTSELNKFLRDLYSEALTVE